MTVAGEQQVLTFFVGEGRFAASAADVAAVFRRPKITRVPNAPTSLLGVAGLRGRAAPVVSLARLLGGEDRAGEHSRLLLLAGEETIGLAVDRVGALASVPIAEVPDAPGGFGHLYRLNDDGVRQLDLGALIRRDFALPAQAARSGPVAAEAERLGPDEPSVGLLGFDLAGQAYALPLEEVDEVLPAPAGLAAFADTDEAVLGVAALRDRLLPVVSLRGLLGLASADEEAGKVVVVRIGAARVGLLVDRLSAVLRVAQGAIDAAPAVLNRGPGTALVETVCRTPGGLVAILSARRLFSDEKTDRILADGHTEATSMDVQQAQDAERFVIFRLGAEEYGLPLAAVEEVARLPERLTRMPNAPDFIEGVLNLRGKVTPIIDQRRRFGAAEAMPSAMPRIVVTAVEGRQAGFIVDAVSEILPIAAAAIEETPTLTADAGRLFDRVTTMADGQRLVLLVEPKELLDRAERDLLASLDATSAAS